MERSCSLHIRFILPLLPFVFTLNLWSPHSSLSRLSVPSCFLLSVAPSGQASPCIISARAPPCSFLHFALFPDPSFLREGLQGWFSSEISCHFGQNFGSGHSRGWCLIYRKGTLGCSAWLCPVTRASSWDGCVLGTRHGCLSFPFRKDWRRAAAFEGAVVRTGSVIDKSGTVVLSIEGGLRSRGFRNLQHPHSKVAWWFVSLVYMSSKEPTFLCLAINVIARPSPSFGIKNI